MTQQVKRGFYRLRLRAIAIALLIIIGWNIMAITLYAATIPSYQQILGAVAGLIDKAEAYCTEQGLAPEAILNAQLAPDMLPFAFQVRSVATHSLGAIKGVQAGVFSPDTSPWPDSFDGLRTVIAAARAGIDALSAADVDALEGNAMRFQFGDDYRMDFTAEDFLLSFSQPNFYFHATTAYDILRHKGAAIGKGDFMGAVRLKM